MATERDISIMDLDRGEAATILTNAYVGDECVAVVKVHILVLEAKDDHLTLLVEQDTEHGRRLVPGVITAQV